MAKKYSVDLRWTNPGVAKYLIESWEFTEFMDAFNHAKEKADKVTDEFFLELRDGNEVIASFNQKQ